MADNTIYIVKRLHSVLSRKGHHLTAAESCTGGMLASAIVDFPGASDILCQSLVTYSNEAKQRILGVNEATLANWGAVSEQTAAEMALGAARSAGCEVSMSTTGIAGPGGGTADKPVGLVYIGCYCYGNVAVRRFLFDGDRGSIRRQAVEEALKLCLSCLEEYEREHGN